MSKSKKEQFDSDIEEDETPQLLEVPEENKKIKKKKEITPEHAQHLERIRKLASEKKKALALADPNSVQNRIKEKKERQQQILEEFEKKQRELQQKEEKAEQEDKAAEEDTEESVVVKKKGTGRAHENPFGEDVVVKGAAYYKNKYRALKQQHQDLAMKTIDALQQKQQRTSSYEDDLIKLELRREQRNNMARLMGINLSD